jgi:signal transduction histidine kinase
VDYLEGNVVIEVSDTGVGIPSSALPFVFDRFRQAGAATSRQFGGTGLGLHLVQQLTMAMGGNVEVESAEGRGSRFTVTLPLSPTTHREASPVGFSGLAPFFLFS